VVTKNAKITVDLGSPGLYRAVKILAIERGLTLREVVIEALRDWVQKQEELEDIKAIEEAEGEPTIPIEEYLAAIGESDLLRKS
jgi:hypothetical protein